ncbi:MAG: diguanylate cyclase response regulator [Deltaproteobacteria bacterium]|nr:diguanylate cyclase response regulator [Deltaproteobacteria bacterium]
MVGLFKIRHVLLVEDRPEEIELVATTLRAVRGMAVDLIVEPDIPGALACLTQRKVDLVLLDLSLTDAYGLEAIDAFRAMAPNMPFIALSPDEGVAADEAIQHGAQDCLLKATMTPQLLGRSMQYAMERHAMLEELRALSLRDELTGLHNRRGFFVLGEQQVRVLKRARRSALLFFGDIDGLKAANDSFGHQVGDQMIVDAAEVLSRCFRDSDIVARLGGDEFAVLAIDVDEDDGAHLLERLQRTMEQRNRVKPHLPLLSMSMGVHPVPVDSQGSLADLVSEADAEMYAEKNRRRTTSTLPHRVSVGVFQNNGVSRSETSR